MLTGRGLQSFQRLRIMGQAKARRLAIKDCYLCGRPLCEPLSQDHVPPQLLFAKALRQRYGITQLLTIPVHQPCNREWQMDEEYFVYTLLPLAGSSEAAHAAHKQSFDKYRSGRNVRLIDMVMNEFRHVVNGVHLPANRVAKLIDADRMHDVIYKIVRGLHFHHNGEILPPLWSGTYTITPPGEPPPDWFPAVLDNLVSQGRYQGVFAYGYRNFPEVNNLHIWAFLLWDCIIITFAFHDPACDCEYCVFVGPRKAGLMPGVIRERR